MGLGQARQGIHCSIILVSFQPPLLLKSTWIFNYLSDPLFILLAQKCRIKPTPCFPSNSLTVFCRNYCTIILSLHFNPFP